MADSAQLDPGFDEVGLDEGFDEVPVTPVHAGSPAIPNDPVANAAKTGTNFLGNAITSSPALTGALMAGNYVKDKLPQFMGGLSKEDEDKKGLSDYINQADTERKAGGQGFLQGATLSGADELAGGLTAVGAKALSPITGEKRSFKELYDAGKTGAKEAFEEARKTSPGATTVGELVGGAAAGEMLPAGYLGKALGLGSKEAILAKLGVKSIPDAIRAGKIGELVSALGPQFLKEIGLAGAENATQGGIQGALASDADLGTAQNQADTASGGKFGGIVGAGIHAGGILGGIATGVGAKYLENKFENPDNIRLQKAKLAYDRVRQGKLAIEPNSEASRNQVAREIGDNNSQFTDRFLNAENNIGKQIGQSIDNASEKGIKVPIDDSLKGMVDDIKNLVKRRPELQFDQQYNKLTDRIFSLENNQLTPADAVALKEDVYNLADKLKDPQFQELARNFAGGVGKSLENSVPGYGDLNAQFKGLREAGRETLMARGGNTDYSTDWIGDFKGGKQKTEKDVKHLISGYSAPGESGIQAGQSLANLTDNLAALEKQELAAGRPSILKQLGYDSIDQVKADVRNKSNLVNLNRAISGYRPSSSTNQPIPTSSTSAIGSLIDAITPSPYGLAQKAAKAVNFGEKALGGTGTPRFNSTNEEAAAWADRYINSQNPTERMHAKALKDALDSNDLPKKNATLFVIQQTHRKSKESDGNEQ